MNITRNMISELIKNINEAENSRPHHTVEETIAAIDSVCAPDFEVRSNKGPFHDRETERQFEKWLFTSMPDYNRTIERTIIDPPYATFEWIVRGTIDDKRVEIHGCSVIECNDGGLLKRGTVYVDTDQFPSQPG
jgi:hypothetical protein